MPTFYPFPHLPFELRARIWEMTVEPRTVEVRIDHKDFLPDPDSDGPDSDADSRMLNIQLHSVPHLRTFTPVPATLQACREARNLGLYQQAFSGVFQDLPRGGRPELEPEPRYVWLNWEIDVVSIGLSRFSSFIPVAPLIKRLRFDPENESVGGDIGYFVNVKEIQVVCNEDFGLWCETADRYPWPCGHENVFCFDPFVEETMKIADIEAMWAVVSEEPEAME